MPIFQDMKELIAKIDFGPKSVLIQEFNELIKPQTSKQSEENSQENARTQDGDSDFTCS